MTIKEFQEAVSKIDHKNNMIYQYFYKLSEEVGELAKALRHDTRLSETKEIKGSVEEELYDVFYYVICLCNVLGIDLEEIGMLKEELNAKKYGRKSIFES